MADTNLATRIDKALTIAVRHGGTDGDRHKAWVIDQMVRALTGCPDEDVVAQDHSGEDYVYMRLGESEEYRTLVEDACGDEYEWDAGIAP